MENQDSDCHASASLICNEETGTCREKEIAGGPCKENSDCIAGKNFLYHYALKFLQTQTYVVDSIQPFLVARHRLLVEVRVLFASKMEMSSAIPPWDWFAMRHQILANHVEIRVPFVRSIMIVKSMFTVQTEFVGRLELR